MTSTKKESRLNCQTRANLPTMDFFNPHSGDDFEPFKTPAAKKPRPAASSVPKKATAKKRVLSDDSDDDFVETPADTKPRTAGSSVPKKKKKKQPPAKKIVLSDDSDSDFVETPRMTPAAKKPAAKTIRAAAEPSKYEVVNGLDGNPLHSEAYMNRAPRRGTSGIPGVTSRSASDGKQFWIPNPYNPDTQRNELLRSLKEPKTDEGLERAAHSLDDWYDQKHVETKNNYWLDKKNFCIDESGQKVRPIPIRVPSRPVCQTTLLHRFGS
jgi:hypothetical protein